MVVSAASSPRRVASFLLAVSMASLLVLAAPAPEEAAVADAAAPAPTPLTVSGVLDPQFKPAPIISVTSTQFNPGLTNAGGTTNSAGTFNVVSLGRSSNYEGPASLQQTTTFQPGSVAVGQAPSVSTPTYLNNPIVTTVPQLPPTTSTTPPVTASPSASGATAASTIAVSAVSTVNAAARGLGWSTSASTAGSVWTLLVPAAAALVGALVVL